MWRQCTTGLHVTNGNGIWGLMQANRKRKWQHRSWDYNGAGIDIKRQHTNNVLLGRCRYQTPFVQILFGQFLVKAEEIGKPTNDWHFLLSEQSDVCSSYHMVSQIRGYAVAYFLWILDPNFHELVTCLLNEVIKYSCNWLNFPVPTYLIRCFDDYICPFFNSR